VERQLEITEIPKPGTQGSDVPSLPAPLRRPGRTIESIREHKPISEPERSALANYIIAMWKRV
jgi:hypothetical protein